MLAGLGWTLGGGAPFTRERARLQMVRKAAELAAKGKNGQAKAEGQSRKGGVRRAGGGGGGERSGAVKAREQGGWA